MIRFLAASIVIAALAPHAHADRVAVVEAPASESLDKRIAQIAEAALPPELAVVSVSVPRSLAKANGEGAIVSVDWRRAPTPGITPIRITVRRPNRRAKRGWARIVLAHKAAVVVANRSLKPGQLIGPGDVSVALRAAPSGSIKTGAKALVGSQVVTAISAGEPILRGQITEPPPVARGSHVTIVVKRGRLRVDTRGTTETAARLGMVVPVRLAGSRRVIRGRLSGRGLVTIEE